ncbi:hypothetical protein MASR1M48_16970 [Lactococcus petauri]
MKSLKQQINEALACFGGLGPQSGIKFARVNSVPVIRTNRSSIIEQIREKLKEFNVEVREIVYVEV